MTKLKKLLAVAYRLSLPWTLSLSPPPTSLKKSGLMTSQLRRWSWFSVHIVTVHQTCVYLSQSWLRSLCKEQNLHHHCENMALLHYPGGRRKRQALHSVRYLPRRMWKYLKSSQRIHITLPELGHVKLLTQIIESSGKLDHSGDW